MRKSWKTISLGYQTWEQQNSANVIDMSVSKTELRRWRWRGGIDTAIGRCSAEAQSRKVDQAGPAWGSTARLGADLKSKQTKSLHSRVFFMWFMLLKPSKFLGDLIYQQHLCEGMLASRIHEQMAHGFRYLNEESGWVGASSCPLSVNYFGLPLYTESHHLHKRKEVK